MKWFQYKKYQNDSVVIDFCKFYERSILEFTSDIAVYKEWPSLLIQLGGADLFYFSLSMVKRIYTVSIWSRHYDNNY